MAIFSLKDDYYQYHKAIENKNEFIARIGYIQNVGKFQIKGYITRMYSPVAFLHLYPPKGTIASTNPDLKPSVIDIYTIGSYYRPNSFNTFLLRYGINIVKNKLKILPSQQGIKATNLSGKLRGEFWEWSYTYKKDDLKVIVDAQKGRNSKKQKTSPPYAGHFRVYYDYNKLDFYNELVYRSNYTFDNKKIDHSFDYTVAIKYHFTRDFSFGIRGENLFNDSYEQAYKNVDKTFNIFDRKLIFNMEYLFWKK